MNTPRILIVVLSLSLSLPLWALTPPSPEVVCCQNYIKTKTLTEKCKETVEDPSKCEALIAEWKQAGKEAVKKIKDLRTPASNGEEKKNPLKKLGF